MGSTQLDVVQHDSEDRPARKRKHAHLADISKMRLQRPEVITPIIHMLGLKRPIREIAKVCRVSNSTVLSVLNDPVHGPQIQQHRAHFTAQARNALRLGIEATVEKYAAPKAKAPPMFDLHLLHQMVTLEEGGATSRVEHTFAMTESDAERDLMRMVDVTPRNVEEREVPRIGSHSQKLHALPIEAEPIQAPDEVRDCEESQPNSDREL